jgi:hypothetical protein
LETDYTGLCLTELCAHSSFLGDVAMEEEASSSRPASDQDRRVRFEDVSDEPEDSSTIGHNNDDPPDEGSGSESGDEKRGAHTQSSAMCPTSPPKQATVQETVDCSPNVSFELQANSTVRIGGNMYSHVQVSNDARLHLGDSITINNFHPDSRKTKMKSMVARIEVTEECLTTLLAAFALLKEMLQTATGLLVLLQVTMSAYRLTKQIKDELVTFEDALGRFQRIDLLFIRDWPAFKQRLQSDFHGTSGSRRILKMRYRLFDRVRGSYLVDPRFPPPFTSVFKKGGHVQMSIHFEWNEVSDEQCPRCELEQECKAGAETTCARCKFSYRGQVESSVVEEIVVDDETLSEGNKREDQDHTLARPEQVQLDRPSSFSRITISKQPISTITSIQSMDQRDVWSIQGNPTTSEHGYQHDDYPPRHTGSLHGQNGSDYYSITQVARRIADFGRRHRGSVDSTDQRRYTDSRERRGRERQPMYYLS